MQKFLLLLISLMPIVASAHPDHSHGTYSVLHYFGGSHLVLLIIAAAASVLAYRLVRRLFLR